MKIHISILDFNINRLILIFIIYIPNLFSQTQISFRQLSVKEGLSQNSAISVTQDSVGYLWIATQDGLNKYDGEKFTVYPFSFVDITNPTYSNLGKVYVDRQGNIWIIPVNKTPYKYNIHSNTFDPISKIKDASIIYQDKNFNLWIGTYSNGLYQIKPNSNLVEKIFSQEEINGTIYHITEKENNDIILLTEKNIIEFNEITKTLNHHYNKALNKENIVLNFSNLTVDETGREWIGTFGKGLYFRKKNEMKLLRSSELSFLGDLPLNLNILDLHIDKKNRLWIATYGRGAYLIDFKKEKITHFKASKNNPKALHYNDILCIYEDYSGVIWLGTDGAGLSYYDEYLEKFNSFINHQVPNDISIDVVRSITVDDSNNIWIGTSGKGLTKYNPTSNTWQSFKKNETKLHALTSNRIMSLNFDDEGDLWIGTQNGGLTIMDKNYHLTNYSKDSEIKLSAKTIWSIFRDSKNRYWLTTRDQGLILFDKNIGEIRKYKTNNNIKNSIGSNNIRVMVEDEHHNFWLGTENSGIIKFNEKNNEFIPYKKVENENSISSNYIKSLYYDSHHNLWIGTKGGGLNLFNPKTNKFKNYTTKDGLANNVIYAILPDDQGNLWLSSNKGITKFSQKDSINNSPMIVNYNNYIGLATEFNTGAYFSDTKKNLYFGGLDGFYWFRPSEIKENPFLPKTTITRFDVFDQPTLLTGDTELKYNENTISFTFSSLQYSLPEKTKYKYKLENYDPDWILANNNNNVRYSYLPPGKYQFKVKSSNYDGIWNETPKTLDFSIALPWYLTNLFKLIFVLFFLSLLTLIYKYLKWRWKIKLDLQLKKEEAEKFKKLNDFKSKMYTDISHEFRTPLTLISGPIDAKLRKGNISEFDHQNFSMIKRNTNRLLSLVDQLLELAKIDSGNLTLKIFQGDLGLFLSTIAHSFEFQANQKNINYKFTIKEVSKAWYDEDAIEKITTNLLSNAFKYCSKNGSCYFNVSKSKDKIFISVKNSVDNVSELQLENIFIRFYQKDEQSEGAGIGLSLVMELVKLYNGNISVNIEENNIIHFKLVLPIRKTLFKNETIIDYKPTKEINDTEIDKEPKTNLKRQLQKNLPILLIVDDHEDIRKFINLSLMHKYNIFEAKNGKEGIEMAIELIPDIVISDVRMPICDGIKLCNTLKTDERTSHLPIILLTAESGEESELKGLESGADDFIVKPFKLRVLETRIANQIEIRKALRKKYGQELVLKAKDIAVSPTDEVFLNKIQKILDTHLSDTSFNAADFSRRVTMSRMQLHRKLLAYFGLTTTAFIRSQRLKQALQILKSSDVTINEIAYTVGFNSPSYFIKCFKEVYKKTPFEYIK